MGSEVGSPAYDAMRDDSRLSQKVWDTMMRGISTRNYAAILPDACECVGVSKSTISREFVLASEEETRCMVATTPCSGVATTNSRT